MIGRTEGDPLDVGGKPPYRIAGHPPGIISDDDYDVTDEALAFLALAPALVAVARAARDLEADVEAITDDGFNLVGHEHILALGAALARLEEPR